MWQRIEKSLPSPLLHFATVYIFHRGKRLLDHPFPP